MEDHPPEVGGHTIMNIPLTPLRFLHHAERQYAGRTAIVCADKRFTYKQFGERVGLLAGALLEAGVKPGDRIAYLGVNTHRLMEAYYGVLEAGAVLLPLNIRLAPTELSYVLNDAGATVLFIEKSFIPLVDSFRESLSTVGLFIQLAGAPEAGWLAPNNYETLLAGATPHRADISLIDEDEVAEIFYTSGTSARPKGVMLTHRNIYMHAMQVCIAFEVQHGSVELHTIPLFHANGWGVAHFLTMLGGKHVMVHSFDPKEIFRLIEVEGVHHFSVVPTMATALVNHPERKNYDLSSLRRIVIGGAASSPTLIREVEEKLGCNCFSGYGLTETSPALSLAQMKPDLNWKGEQRYFGQAMTGYAMPGVEMRIVDSNDQDLPQNGIAFGELIVRGDGVMKGYWNQPDASAEVFRGGWFHTGDMATLNEEGYALIVDRKKDMIVSGGENISSLEVERVILAHPSILEAAVIPVYDQKWGEVPKALVVLRAGASVSESQLIEFCRSQLARYKCPHSVAIVDSLPKTGTGKVLKKELRKQYERAPSRSPATALN
jgi:fatty-acyl-CoA synthase